VLYAKRLESGGFRWPQIEGGVMRLTAVQLSALIAGMEWTRMLSPRRTRTPREVS
jgi:transposase